MTRINKTGPYNKVFSSDNADGASAEVLQAMVNAGSGPESPYGVDTYSQQVEQQLSAIFECPVSVFLVPTGTAANALGLSVLTPPWGAVLCHPHSHINNDECGAPEFFTNGAKLICIDGDSSKIGAQNLANVASKKVGDVHSSQAAVVSISQSTETGSLYSVDEIQAIGDICHDNGLRLHMDGARFANALVAMDCSAADMTWKAGVDVLSFGATKNGVLGAEAIVLFDPSLAQELAFRRKRAGHLMSKMRLMSAQMNAYLKHDLWLSNARHANQMCARLVRGLQAIVGIEIECQCQSNILFCKIPRFAIDGLLAQGFHFYSDRWDKNVVRLVTNFSTQADDVDHFVAAAKALLVAQVND